MDGSGPDTAVAEDGILDECLGEVGVFGGVHLPSHRLAGGITLVDLRATPAKLGWSKQAPRELTSDPTKLSCVLYLGQSGATVVVYNAKTSSLIKLPASDVFVGIGDPSLDKECVR